MRRLILAIALAAGLGSLSISIASAGGGGGGCHEPLTSGSGDAVAISELCFSPTVLYVEPGDEVTWTNRDKALHNVLAVGADWSHGRTDGRGIPVDGSTSITFDAAGVYPYYCGFHPGMVGVVVVGDPAASGAGAASSAEASAPRAGSSRLPASVIASGGVLAVALAGGGIATLRRRRR